MRNEPELSVSADFYAKRAEWIDYVSTRSDITHGDFRVAYFMARKMNADKKNMWWSVATIAQAMGVSTHTVSAATVRLQDAGLLVVTRPARGVNTYSFRMPYDPEGPKRRLRKPRTTQKLRT